MQGVKNLINLRRMGPVPRRLKRLVLQNINNPGLKSFTFCMVHVDQYTNSK